MCCCCSQIRSQILILPCYLASVQIMSHHICVQTLEQITNRHLPEKRGDLQSAVRNGISLIVS